MRLWAFVSIAPALVAGSLDAAEFRRLIQEEVDKRVAPLQATVAQLQEENARLVASDARRRVAADVSPFGGTGRKLLHDSSSASCCRWTPDSSCPSTSRACTELHEYLEAKTTTHEFAAVEGSNCLGSDESAWSWAYNGHTGNVTLSSGGSAVSSFATPLKVTHAASCGSTLPTMEVQMDTTLQRNVEVKGSLMVGSYVVPALGPSIDKLTYGGTGNSFSTDPTNVWTSFASKAIALTTASKVLVWYSVVTASTSYVVTTLYVDSGSGETELPDARAISGKGYDTYMTLSGMYMGSLAVGTHTFIVGALVHAIVAMRQRAFPGNCGPPSCGVLSGAELPKPTGRGWLSFAPPSLLRALSRAPRRPNRGAIKLEFTDTETLSPRTSKSSCCPTEDEVLAVGSGSCVLTPAFLDDRGRYGPRKTA